LIETEYGRHRSIPLAHFGTIANVPGVRLISLHKGPTSTPPQSVAELFEVIEPCGLDEQAGPLMDTAAIMKNLDLVITADTSTAHLAGALGIPVWVAIP